MCERMGMDISPSQLARDAGISKSYASEILSGKRELGLVAALNLYRKCGHRFGPVAEMSDDQLAALAQ